jgi:uncharacterized protein YyaL (SSP411 family)
MKTLLWVDGGEIQEKLAQKLPHLTGIKPVQSKPAAYVCSGHSCQPPVTDPALLQL